MRSRTGGSNFFLYLFAGAKTGVKQALCFQLVQCLTVIVKMLGLAANRLLPFQTQPCQIIINACLIFGVAATGINIFDAENKTPARITGLIRGEKSGKGMPQMQSPRWGRGEACHYVISGLVIQPVVRV